jgi:hypothetical protein
MNQPDARLRGKAELGREDIGSLCGEQRQDCVIGRAGTDQHMLVEFKTCLMKDQNRSVMAQLLGNSGQSEYYQISGRFLTTISVFSHCFLSYNNVEEENN